MNDDNRRIAKNTIYLYSRMIVMMLVTLYTSRIILEKLGVDDYGIYQAVGGIVGFLSFINGVLSTGTSRFLTFELGTGNMEKLKRTFSTLLTSHIILALFIVFLAETGVMPSLNQFECHPLFTQKELVDYCNEHGIQIEAYTPIARADTRMTRLPLMKRMAEKYKKTIVQIVIRWHIQNGRIPIVGARHKKNQMADLDVFDFNLTDDELKAIDAINLSKSPTPIK
jgi:hypothetical protein